MLGVRKRDHNILDEKLRFKKKKSIHSLNTFLLKEKIKVCVEKYMTRCKNDYLSIIEL